MFFIYYWFDNAAKLQKSFKLIAFYDKKMTFINKIIDKRQNTAISIEIFRHKKGNFIENFLYLHYNLLCNTASKKHKPNN